MHLLRLIILLLLLMPVAPVAAVAQTAAEAQTAPEAQTTPGAESEPSAAPSPIPDLFGRETPRSSITGLIAALAERDYALAANYFDLPVQGNPGVASDAVELAQRLQAGLDSDGTLASFSELSNEETGRIDDALATDREQVGSLTSSDGAEVPVLLTRSPGPDGQQVWRISKETIRDLAARSPAQPATEVAEQDPPFEVAGAPVKDWLLLLGLAAGSFFLFRVIAAGILALMRLFITDRDRSAFYRFIEAALPPLSLFLAVAAFYQWGERLEVAIVARQTLLRYAGVVAAIAGVWFLMRLVDAIAAVATARMQRRARRQAVSVITLLRRAAKVLLLVIAMVAVLDTFGVDVTTGIAALGIGGIALALGAQKTIENLVGSLTVIADRPVQVGDFCRVGDVLGTVEDVGIRSTRIRTNDRTIVTIPNGNFSSLQIENFSKRDRFLFNPVVGVEYGISAAKLREAVELIERVLMEHPQIDSDGARARLANFGKSSLDIEVFSYIAVSDFDESVDVRQQLLLTIFERLEAAGVSVAFPTRTVHLVRPSISNREHPHRRSKESES